MGSEPSASAPEPPPSLTEGERRNLQVKLRRHSSGGREAAVTAEAFDRLMGIPNHDFCRRLFAVIDADSSGKITLDEAVWALEQVSDRADLEARVRFCFSLYDADGSGEIDREEFTEIIKLGLTNLGTTEVPPATLKKRAGTLFERVDLDGDEKITYAEFLRAAEDDPAITDFIGVALQRLTSAND